MVAFQCGFSGTSIGVASTTLNLSTTAYFKPATFTFPTPLTTTHSCGDGSARIALKLTPVSSLNTVTQLYFGVIHSGNLACAMKVSTDVFSSTPTQQSTFEAIANWN